MKALRIGTRGSALALWQARAVAAAIEPRGAAVEIVTISTRGDRRQDVPLADIGGKGVFVKEIHDALLAGTIDLAVHSAKDMAAASPDGLTIAAVLAREDPRDALVLPVHSAQGFNPASPFPSNPSPRLATGSPRRIAQLRRSIPGARFEPIRGNVDTRLRKLDEGEADALVLACAGLRRLGLAHRITGAIPVEICVPAPGQGIIAVETRATDRETIDLLAPLNDPSAGAALAAEQAVVAGLGGGCQLPLGAYAEIRGRALTIHAVAASLAGDGVVEGHVAGDAGDPIEAGRRLAQELTSRGALEMLLS